MQKLIWGFFGNMKIIDPYIFRDYDIRGVVGASFNEKLVQEYERWYGKFPGLTLPLELAEKIGQAYGTIIRKEGGKKVLIGHELRPFAEELTNAFIKGTRKSGCDVIDAGVTLTPIVYFLNQHLSFDGGVNVTGSHNVYFFNGFKLMKKGNWPLYGEEIQKLKKMIEDEDLLEDSQGGYEKIEGFPEYEKYFLSHIKLSKKMKVVIDTGNGSAGMFAPDLFKKLGCEVIGLYTEVDTSFPNHIPDPEARQSLGELQKLVVKEKADLGIAFDADGDRVGFITEKGEYVDTDMPLLLLAKDALTRNPGKKVLFDAKCSQLLEELVPQYGGVPLMHRTGHAPIKETLRKDSDITIAGEVSGHLFLCEDYYKIDDGLYSGAKVLELVANSGKELSALIDQFPKRVRTPEIKLPCADEAKDKVVGEITAKLQKNYSVRTVDGARFQYNEKGWGLIRKSNTSPYITIRVEAETEDEVLKIKNILADELEKYPEVGDKLNRKEVTTLTGRLGWL